MDLRAFFWMILCIYSLNIYSTFSSQNIAHGKKAFSNTPYKTQWNASKAVDGDTNSNVYCNSCLHTNNTPNLPQAYLKVDLEANYTVSRVEIYFLRSACGNPCERDTNTCDKNDTNVQQRSKGYYVQLDDGNKNKTCYHDESANRPDFMENNTCIGTGQSIGIVQNNTSDEDTGHGIVSPMLEICELKVFGCPVGRFGDTCEKACSIHCKKQICNPDTGKCLHGCNEYWRGEMCDILLKNIAYGKKAFSNTPYKTQWNALKAVDGDTNSNVDCNSCLHTNNTPNLSQAYLKVDLEANYTVSRVEIYFLRSACGNPCERDTNTCDKNDTNVQQRSKGYYVQLDDGNKNKTCYHDESANRPDFMENNTCIGTGQSISIVQNNTSDEDTGHGIVSPMLEICELKVFGCPAGKFGVKCDKPCSVRCKKQICNPDTGKCLHGCSKNWRGKMCNILSECQPGTYGFNCTESCGHCLNASQCLRENGSCPHNACQEGYQGPLCAECIDGRFGFHCTETCGYCLNGLHCNKIHGQCPEDKCAPGYTGKMCKTRCSNGRFGFNCSETCGFCRNNATCEKKNGACPDRLCDLGYNGTRCKSECLNGTYGYNCNEKCGHCRDKVSCDKRSGACPESACAPGHNGTRCKTACLFGTYGYNCNASCGHCRNKAPCDMRNGTCPDSACAPGYNGKLCTIECLDGTYGYNCNETCGFCRSNDTCNKKNGTCPNFSCERGYNGTLCKIECLNGTYGYNCDDVCGHCRNEVSCDKVNGTCPNSKCARGYNGTLCTKECTYGRFGFDCSEKCGYCRNKSQCDRRTGECPNFQCDAGYNGTQCKAGCNNTYGFNCRNPCGECIDAQCNPINGKCAKGCRQRYKPPMCNEKEEKLSGPDPGGIIGGSVGAIVLLALVAIVVVVALRRWKVNTKEDSSRNSAIPKQKSADAGLYANVSTNPAFDDMENIDQNEEGLSASDAQYENFSPVETSVHAIPISKLQDVIQQKEKSKKFSAEFEALPRGHLKPCLAAELPENRAKNRFKTTFPYDESRIILKTGEDGKSDYINASYIKDLVGKRAYIASQGPKEHTVVDMWRMIWQRNISVVTMLTNLQEKRIHKCAKYWPDLPSTSRYGIYAITAEEEIVHSNYIVRTLTVKNTKNNAVRHVTHFHYTTWPDHGVPEPLDLIDFYERVRRKISTNDSDAPTLVHCSAGIGRTGTFIALDALLRNSKDSQNINVFQYIKRMREEDRMNMIQTVDQYTTVHFLLLEALQAKFYPIPKARFVEEAQKMCKSSAPANRNVLRKHISELNELRPRYTDADFEGGLRNPDLNRDKSILPVDKYRLYLSSYVKGRSDYINAVTVPSQSSLHAIIVTNSPTQATAVDLIRLIVDHGSLLVILGDDLEDRKYWLPPYSDSINCEPYSVERSAKKQNTSPGVDESDITVTQKKDAKSQTYRVFESTSWPSSYSDTIDVSVIVNMIKRVMAWGTSPDGKIIVVSKDGVHGCDVFCAVYNAIEQLQLDEEVDMFNIVRQLQIRRPQFCPSMEELKLSLQAVIYDLTSSESIYANTE